MLRNNQDNRQALEMGESAEHLFHLLALKNGYDVSECSDYKTNAIDHIDFILSHVLIDPIKVEVKGLKRINSTDKVPDDSLICLELMGITGKPGWLFGKADVIAFKLNDGFYLINRLRVIEKLKTLVNIESPPVQSTKNKQKHIIYRRSQFGRLDKIVYITKEELLSIDQKEIWNA